MKQKVIIGIIGCGTVGRGVVEIFQRNRTILEQKSGCELELGYICDRNPRLRRFLPRPFQKHWAEDYRVVLNDRRVAIVVELIGGYEPARTIISSALKNKKQVVTANKALLATHWGELFRLARSQHGLIYFEAAVGGGIPVIQALNEGLAANYIKKIVGILNGTTNYILGRMSSAGCSFQQALKEARQAGFAEMDSRMDVEGWDTAHKLVILSSLACGGWVKLENVVREGINRVEPLDLVFAREEFGYVLKLLGIARQGKNGSVQVRPTLIPLNHPFARVEKEENAVLFEGDAVGQVFLSGKGAGSLPAASAVVSDITCLARQVANGTAGRLPYVSYDPDKDLRYLPPEEEIGRFYIRFTTVDRPGVLAQIAGILGKYQISIASVYQKGKLAPEKAVPIILLTHQAKFGRLVSAIRKIDRLPIVRRKSVFYWIEE